MADSYDAFIRRAVPRYEEMTLRLLDYLPDYLPVEATRIVELGCGTGNLSLRLAARYPGAHLTLVDAAPEMISTTRERLVAAYPRVRVEYVTGRFEALGLPAGGFDLVTSSISLHHVIDKAALYTEIFDMLRPGGSLRFSDQLGGSARDHGHNWRRWLEHCRQPGNCDEAEVQSLLDHAAAHDHYTPLVEHFAMLTRCGFVELDCLWRNWIWGIVAAQRP